MAALLSAGAAADRPLPPIAPTTAAVVHSGAWDFAAATEHLLRLRDDLLGKAGEGKLPAILDGYTGNDTCRWANDGECDDPGLGTGACQLGTDYADCWRLATDREDDSCRYAKDGECDEPHFGTGACTQGTDRTDCGAVAFLRFRDDSCRLAFNGVCNEPGTGDGACAARTDRADCVGRDRPMTIADHYFGHDDRGLLDTTVPPWSAVGTLTAEDGGGCTATLIAADVLITAAHCIEGEGGTIDARATFETAFGRKDMITGAQVTAYYMSPDRARDRSQNEEAAGTDWVLLRIDQPLGDFAGILGVRGLAGHYGEAVPSLTVLQGGYSWDTGANLSGNLRCAFLAVEAANKVIHNCDTTHGDSGSPLLVRDGDAYFIVATDSTFRTVPGEPAVNVAARTDAWIGYLADFASGRIGEPALSTAPRK